MAGRLHAAGCKVILASRKEAELRKLGEELAASGLVRDCVAAARSELGASRGLAQAELNKIASNPVFSPEMIAYAWSLVCTDHRAKLGKMKTDLERQMLDHYFLGTVAPLVQQTFGLNIA